MSFTLPVYTLLIKLGMGTCGVGFLRIQRSEFSDEEYNDEVRKYDLKAAAARDSKTWYRHHKKKEANEIMGILQELPGGVNLCRSLKDLQLLQSSPSKFIRSTTRARLKISTHNNVLYVEMLHCAAEEGLTTANERLEERRRNGATTPQ